jgi:uncharacterized protein DUF3987
MTGSITPGPLMAYLRDVFGDGTQDDGLIQRFQIPVWPDAIEGVGKDTPRNDETYGNVLEIFRTLDRMLVRDRFQPMTDKYDPDGMPFIGFSADAQEVMTDYLREIAHKMRTLGPNEHPALTSHFSKYRSLMPTLALIHHVVAHAAGNATSKPVSLEAAKLARKSCKILATHAKRMYSSLRRQRPSERGADALYKKILAHEIGAEPMKARDVQRAMPTVFDDVEAVEAALSNLTKRGVVAPRPVPTGAKRGPQLTKVYDLNPRVFEVNKSSGREPGEEG